MTPHNAPENPPLDDRSPTISFQPNLLNDLRARAVDGMNRLRHGGVEIGGILLGIRSQGVIRILDHRSLSCEHIYGPGFILSPKDEANLRLLLGQPLPGGLDPVGWYHSHTRSDLALNDRDVELHNGFFPDPESVALVLCPAPNGSAEAYFHVRNAEGGFDPVAPARVQTLLPPERPARLESTPKPPTPPAAPPVRRDTRREEAPALAVKPWMVAALCVGWFTAGLFLAGFQPGTPAAAPKPLALTVEDRDGLMQIGWERNAPSLRNATHAFLSVSEGSNVRRIDLTPDLLQSGSLTLQRQASQVDLELTVYGDGQPPDLAAARFVGAPPAAGADGKPMRSRIAASRGGRQRPTQRQDPPQPPRAQPAPLADLVAKPSSSPPPPAPGEVVVEMAPRAPAVPALIEHAPRPQAAKPERSSGRVIWTGHLPKNHLLLIEGGRPSVGVLNAPLPALPIHVEAMPASLTGDGLTVYSRERRTREIAAIDNGWNETVYKRDARRAGDLVLAEPPAAPNNWSKLALRGERDLSAIVIHWRRIEP